MLMFCSTPPHSSPLQPNCLEAHLKDLSDECYDRLEKRAQPHKGARSQTPPASAIMASPPPPQSKFIPTLLATLLSIVVLGVVWKIVYDQITTTYQDQTKAPNPASAVPDAAPLLPSIPALPKDPPAPSPRQERAPVHAIEPPQQLTLPEEAHEHRGLTISCKVELKRLCADVQPGGGRLKRCYQERENQLPLPCQQQVEEQAALKRAAQQRVTVQCAADVRKLCALVKPGEGRIQQCLEDHNQDLSHDCYQALDERLKMN